MAAKKKRRPSRRQQFWMRLVTGALLAACLATPLTLHAYLYIDEQVRKIQRLERANMALWQILDYHSDRHYELEAEVQCLEFLEYNVPPIKCSKYYQEHFGQ